MNGEEKYFYEFESFRLNVEERQLLDDKVPVPLTPKAFEVLTVLVKRNGHLIEKDELLQLVWTDSFVEEANLARIIHTLRKILGEDKNGIKFIETVPKKGYRFAAAVHRQQIKSTDFFDTPDETAFGIHQSKDNSTIENNFAGEADWTKNFSAQTSRDLLFDLKNLPLDLVENSNFESDSEENLIALQKQHFSTDGQSKPLTKYREDTKQKHPLTNAPRWIWAVSALIILFIIFAGWTWRQSKQAEINPSASLSISQFFNWKRDLGEDLESSARFSPDGKLVAFSSTRSGVSSVWLKQIEGGEPFTRKQDKWAESSPIFSPDGQQIAFLSKRGEQSGIWAMPTLGGTPILLKSLEESLKQLVKWSKDGKTIYFQMSNNLFALDLSSREITKLTDLDSSQTARTSFDISNDEKLIAYVSKQNKQIDIWVVSKNGGEPIRVTNDEFEENNLVWHPDGQRIIYDSVRNGIRQIFSVRLDGSPPEQLMFSDNSTYVSDISPDGKKILSCSQRDDADLWKISLEDSKETRLTENIGMEFWADGAPDNSTFVFQVERPTNVIGRVYHSSIISQTTGAENQSLQLTDEGFLPRLSPNGQQMAFIRLNDLTNLWIVPSIGGESKPLTIEGMSFGGSFDLPLNRSNVQEYQWSPDGQRLIYCARRGNISNVWQTMSDGSGEKRLTDNNDPAFRFFAPILAPDNQRIAWLGFVLPTGDQKNIKWSVWIYEEGKTKMVFESESVLRLIGWTQSGNELIIKTVTGKNRDPKFPADIDLLKISSKGEVSSMFQLSAANLFSISISPDRQNIAYVTRKDGADSIHIISTKDGADRKILESNDTRVYFAGLAWSPDSKSIYFGKQANWQVISMIENFK